MLILAFEATNSLVHCPTNGSFILSKKMSLFGKKFATGKFPVSNLSFADRQFCQYIANKYIILELLFFFAGLSMCSIMIALLGLSYLLFDPLVKHMVLSKLVLRNNSGFAELWKNPPIKPHFKVYFFNLTNAEDFMNGKANPHVQEIGPYTYQ